MKFLIYIEFNFQDKGSLRKQSEANKKVPQSKLGQNPLRQEVQNRVLIQLIKSYTLNAKGKLI